MFLSREASSVFKRQPKAKLAMLGLDAKVSERDQAGRMVYRVRMGPFSDKNVAERIRTQLESNGIENTLVRVQR